MFGLRSARSRAIAVGALGLLLLSGVATTATVDRGPGIILWLSIGLSTAALVAVATSVTVVILSTTRPLAALQASARAIAAGDLRARAGVSGPEEVASLARDFNAMTDALAAKAQEYIDTTNLTGDIIVKIDRRGRWTFLNDAACQFFGGLREELLGTDSGASLHPDDSKATAQAIREVRANRNLTKRFVNRFVTRTGTRVVEWNGHALFDEDGRYAGVQGTGRDITERKQADEALRESEKRFRTLSDATFEAIALHKKGKIVDANQTYADMFGYEPSEIIGMHALDFAAPESRDLVWQAILSGREEPFEAIGLRKDGSTFVGEICGKAIPYQGRMVTVAAIRDVSERKRAEEALRESEQRYRLLAENVTDVIWTMDTNLRFTYVSPSVARMRGDTSEELVGRKLKEILTPASFDVVMKAIAEERAVEEMGDKDPFRSRTVELEQVHKDGSTAWAEVRATVLRDPDGQPIGILGVSRDISERKRAEEVLRESEERYRLLAENATDVIWTMDLNLRLTYVSPSVRRLRGYTVEEAMAQTREEALTPASLETARKVLAEELARESAAQKNRTRSRTLELEEICKNGSTVWTEVGVSFLRDSDGRPIGILGVSRDISERKRAQEALRESEEKFRNIFQSASDGIAYLDTSGIILDVNDKAVELFGGPREELLGKQFTTVGVFHRKDIEPLVTGFASVLGGEKVSVEIRIRNRKGQERFLDCSACTLKTDDKTPSMVVLAARDITKRKRAEEALRKAREDIESRVERRMQQLNGYNLTFRELAVLHLVAAGEADKEIATVLDISPLTAHKHIANILEKMGAASRTEAGVRALREGLLD